jgi:hypothetical protein
MNSDVLCVHVFSRPFPIAVTTHKCFTPTIVTSSHTLELTIDVTVIDRCLNEVAKELKQHIERVSFADILEHCDSQHSPIGEGLFDVFGLH